MHSLICVGHNALTEPIVEVGIIELADRIDRDKLVAAHNAVFAEKQKLTRKNDLLSRTLLKHFRQKKVDRAYIADNLDTIDEMSERYLNSLDQLDKVCGCVCLVSELFYVIRIIDRLHYRLNK